MRDEFEKDWAKLQKIPSEELKKRREDSSNRKHRAITNALQCRINKFGNIGGSKL